MKNQYEIDYQQGYDRANDEWLERIDKIKAEIETCLNALDEIEKSGLHIFLPNEISGRRLTYQQCLEFIEKYKTEQENT